jgi:threonine synthase
MAFEIVEQNGWQPPGVVLCPVGAGSILLGLFKVFAELQASGVISRLPRLFAVQAASVSPVYQAYERHDEDVLPCDAPRPTLAEGIALPRPIRGRLLLRALRETRGGVVAVSEEGIGQGVLTLGRLGICVEPTSAVVLNAYEQLADAGLINPDEQVVLVLSGFGLKASVTLQQLINL